MATLLDALKDELYAFFNSDIVQIIKKEKHTPELLVTIREKFEEKFEGKFSNKYSFLVKQYEDTIRISATYKPLGIVFFMAQHKSGAKKFKFLDPCYWGETK